jgi:hypothetical protein
MMRKKRYGKDTAGEHTPPISQLLDGHLSLSDVAASDAAPTPSNASIASFLAGSTSRAPDPTQGLAAVDSAAGSAHSVFQPTPGHMKINDQTSVPLDYHLPP